MIVSSTRRPYARVFRAALALSFLVLLPPSLLAQKTAAPPVPDSLDRLNQAVDGLTRKVWPSVVQIMVTGYGAREESGRGDAHHVHDAPAIAGLGLRHRSRGLHHD